MSNVATKQETISKTSGVAAREVFAKSAPIKGSMYKIALVASLVRGLNVADALMQLRFCRKRAAKDVAEVLSSAVANAENNANLDIDRLVVSRILVGKAFDLRRFAARARGRSSRINKSFSKITVYVSERA